MDNFEFNELPETIHYCSSHREGDWITWRCPLCEGYERRLNWKTGEMRVRRGGSTAQHTGFSTKEQNMEALARCVSEN